MQLINPVDLDYNSLQPDSLPPTLKWTQQQKKFIALIFGEVQKSNHNFSYQRTVSIKSLCVLCVFSCVVVFCFTLSRRKIHVCKTENERQPFGAD